MGSPTHCLSLAVLLILLLHTAAGKYDCYDRQQKEYIGNSTQLPESCTGCVCLPWPPEYGFSHNYCRFVAGWDLPQCLVTNYLGLHLEDCDIPACDIHTTCYRGDGSTYINGGHFTETGHQCLDWMSAQVLSVPGSFFTSSERWGNNCRNPNGQSRPWCYFSANGTVQQGFCPIKQCVTEAIGEFDQHLQQTISYGLVTANERPVSFGDGVQFSVEFCLDSCLQHEEFVCSSVVVDTFRQTCTMLDTDRYHVQPRPFKDADLYTRRNLCDVFDANEYDLSEDCLLPLGLQAGLIQDSQITASSYLNNDHAPWAGRLYGNSSWMPDPASTQMPHFLQIDLLERMKIVGLAVQGGGKRDVQAWVEELEVLVTHDLLQGKWDKLGVYHASVTEYGSTIPHAFAANRESVCIALVMFGDAVYTRYLQVRPKKWHQLVALRLEVIGCRDTGCENTLGMINGQIPDSAITFSSIDGINHKQFKHGVRLSLFHADTPVGGWIPDSDDVIPFVSVELQRPYLLTAVVTQGCEGGVVTSIVVSHNSNLLEPYSSLVTAKIQTTQVIGKYANGTNSTLRHTFKSPVALRRVVITPVTWQGVLCMSIELVGCLHISGCNLRLGMQSGLITNHQLTTQRNGIAWPVAARGTPRLHQWAGLFTGITLGDTAGGDWLQIDLVVPHTLTGLGVQGGRDRQYSTWVDAFRLLYNTAWSRSVNEPDSWKVYRNLDHTESLFDVPHSPYTVTRHSLQQSFITDKIRLELVTWTSVYPGLRVEVIGCALAEHGDFCSERTVQDLGRCLGKIDSDVVGACSDILGHDATPVVIHSPSAFSNFMDQTHLTLDTYLIGLHLINTTGSDQTAVGSHRFVWSDGSPLTYSNFLGGRVPTSVEQGENCVAMESGDSHIWMTQICLPKTDRGTICQYDLDECAGNHGCSYKCLNFPGGYQCLCPPGFVMDDEMFKNCTPLCSHLKQATGVTWYQWGNWCYTRSTTLATWHEANSACLAFDGGSRLPDATDEFWVASNISRQMIWIRGQRNSTESRCLARVPPAGSSGLGKISTLNCSASLPYICIIEFKTLGDRAYDATQQEEVASNDLRLIANSSFGLVRRWYYPPHTFTNNQLITFEFTAPINHTLRFEMIRMCLKNNSCNGNLTMFNKFADGSRTLHGSYVGRWRRVVVLQSSNAEVVLTISPQTSSRPQAVGLELLYTVIKCAGDCSSKCGWTPPVQTSSTGAIDTRMLPVGPFAVCNWVIRVEHGKYINLTFTEFDINMQNRIVLSSEDSTDFSLSYNYQPPNIITNTTSLIVQLTVDSEAETVGFLANYTTVDMPKCNPDPHTCDVNCSYQRAYISSPLYPTDNQQNLECHWRISTSPGTYIKIVFVDFDIPTGTSSYDNSYLKVYDGSSFHVEDLLHKFNNAMPPSQPVTTRFNAATLGLMTQQMTEGKGFLARYEALRFQPKRNVVVTRVNCSETGWYHYNGHCYFFNATSTPSPIRWTDAEQYCNAHDAHLVSINDAHEADYVHYMLTGIWWTGNLTYIGLTDRNEQGLFRWADNSPMTYTDWTVHFESGEGEDERFEYVYPNGGQLKECTYYAVRDIASSSSWIDTACAATDTNQFLCEKEASDYVPPPAIGNFVLPESKLVCPRHMFTCASGECIQNILQCDSTLDCSDGSDEAVALCSGQNFDKFRFQCGNAVSIPASLYCDFYANCQEPALDENTCVYPNCTDSQFRCLTGQCIATNRSCDLVVDCIGQTRDGIKCKSFTDGFQCFSGRWLPTSIVCDGYPDCPGTNHEDEAHCDYEKHCNSSGIRCRMRNCVDGSHRCLYDLDQFGFMTGCRDATHLRDCGLFECPAMTFKCPESYCIPIRFRCNGVEDCSNGEDERGCADYVCAGAYKCMSTGYCISLDKVCDGVYDCVNRLGEGKDDELFCNVDCPTGCVCVGLSYSCENTEWNRQAAGMIPRDVRQLERRDANYVAETVAALLFIDMKNYPWILDLELKNNGIVHLEPGTFSQNKNMKSLDLSGNDILVLRRDAFLGLSNLQHMSLADNILSEIEVGAFRGLPKLSTIDVRNITPVKSSDAFNGINGLDTMIASQHLFCCLDVDIAECDSPIDQFSDCSNLISDPAFRVFIWLLGLSALAGNLLVFGLRLLKGCRRGQRDSSPVQTFLITNLAASDFLMGVYMITIAGADAHFRDNYAFAAPGWRESVTCKVAGMLSVLSSEVSVFVVMIISVERFMKIVFPFRFGLHLTLKKVHCLVLGAWVLGILMSVVPGVMPVYFAETYYGKSSVCLALPLTTELLSGWEYTFVILGVNFFCFFAMLCCYVGIFAAVRRSSRNSRGGKARSSQGSRTAADVRIATKMALIVGTDFVCWMPIIILAVLASFAKVTVPRTVYVLIAVFILPLNSSINPYLYTLSNYWGRRKKAIKSSVILSPNPVRLSTSVQESKVGGYTNEALSPDTGLSTELQPTLKTVLRKLAQHRIIPVHGELSLHPAPSPRDKPPNGHVSGTASPVQRSDPSHELTGDDVTSIEEDVTTALTWLHANDISGIGLDEDSLQLERDTDGKVRAFLKLRQSIIGAREPDAKQRRADGDKEIERDKKALESIINSFKRNIVITTNN